MLIVQQCCSWRCCKCGSLWGQTIGPKHVIQTEISV